MTNFIRQLMTADPESEGFPAPASHAEDMEKINLDDFATIEPHEMHIPIEVITEARKPQKNKLDRRALLLGQFQEGD
jgi:hypothetical protein